MTRYLVAIGSNIRPEQNTPLILGELQAESPTLHISRIVETEAVDMIDADPFLNLVAAIDVRLNGRQVKDWFNSIEAKLGRDRSNPLRGQLGRTADLDIILSLEDGESSVDAATLPSEPHVRPMLLELLHYLGIDSPQPPSLPEPTPIQYNGHQVGERATTLGSA